MSLGKLRMYCVEPLLIQIDDPNPVGDDHGVLEKHEEIWKEADEDLDDQEFDQSRGLLQALWRDEGSKDMVVIAGRQGDVITCHASVFAMASDFARYYDNLLAQIPFNFFLVKGEYMPN